MYQSLTEDKSLKAQIDNTCDFRKTCTECEYCAWCKLEEVFYRYPDVLERIESGKKFIKRRINGNENVVAR